MISKLDCYIELINCDVYFDCNMNKKSKLVYVHAVSEFCSSSRFWEKFGHVNLIKKEPSVAGRSLLIFTWRAWDLDLGPVGLYDSYTNTRLYILLIPNKRKAPI